MKRRKKKCYLSDRALPVLPCSRGVLSKHYGSALSFGYDNICKAEYRQTTKNHYLICYTPTKTLTIVKNWKVERDIYYSLDSFGSLDFFGSLDSLSSLNLCDFFPSLDPLDLVYSLNPPNFRYQDFTPLLKHLVVVDPKSTTTPGTHKCLYARLTAAVQVVLSLIQFGQVTRGRAWKQKEEVGCREGWSLGCKERGTSRVRKGRGTSLASKEEGTCL